LTRAEPGAAAPPGRPPEHRATAKADQNPDPPEAACVVLTTAGSAEEAQKIAGALVAGKKAACVQMVPVSSCYVWAGKIMNEQEVLLVVKTRRSLYGDVETLIRALHSYETPEIVCLPVAAGAKPYLDWILSVTG
jgi:periplasmic divalent cation tolerance protein